MRNRFTFAAACAATLSLTVVSAAAGASTPTQAAPTAAQSAAQRALMTPRNDHTKTADPKVLDAKPVKADATFGRDLCASPQAAADELGDSAAHRVKVGGTKQRRTLYLEDGAYVVQRCRPDGTLKRATLYTLHETIPGTREYLPERRIDSDVEGRVVVTVPEYIDPLAPGSQETWRAAKEDGPLAEAPASTDALTGPEPEARTTEGRAASRAYGNDHPRCFNWNYNTLAEGTTDHYSLWPNRGFTFYTNLPNGSWDQLVDAGRRTIDETWNQCGWDLPWKTKSYWGGSIAGAGINPWDGGSVITMGSAADAQWHCHSAGVLACAMFTLEGGYVSGPGGQTRRISSVDILFNGDQPWTSGAAPGFYDVWSTATHELGHAYGLWHVSGGAYDDWLVMYPYINSNDERNRWLAAGDYSGIASLYP